MSMFTSRQESAVEEMTAVTPLFPPAVEPTVGEPEFAKAQFVGGPLMVVSDMMDAAVLGEALTDQMKDVQHRMGVLAGTAVSADELVQGMAELMGKFRRLQGMAAHLESMGVRW